MPEKICAKCVHYEAVDDREGFCRRYAPRPFVGPESNLLADSSINWPPVDSTDWCGEFQESWPTS